jgi:regulatory protein
MEIPSEIMTKIERFCAYQERCENDVRKKLTSFHLSEGQEDAVIKSLRENNFLDEERFVEVFVRGKVRVGWGVQKIVAALRAKRIPQPLIDRCCARIPADSYQDSLRKAIEKWRRSHPDEPANSPKLVRHLLSKGFGMEEAMGELVVSS